MRTAVEKKIGSLKTFYIEGAAQGPCVVLFHGYGADAADLLPLADMANLSSDVTWVFPEAPIEVIIAPGFYGKAWFQIDMDRLQQSLSRGEVADLSKTVPGGLAQAKKIADSFYEALTKLHKKIILGGFSQGAMLATDLTLTTSQKPAGLVILSGNLICQDIWQKAAKTCDGLPFFQSHGKNDAILGHAQAEKLFELLSDAGLNGEFLSFSGGHEIPPKVIEKMARFIGQCFKNK